MPIYITPFSGLRIFKLLLKFGLFGFLIIRDRQRVKIAEMNAFLQACVTLQEAQVTLPDFLQPLFPNCSGAVYLIDNSKKLLEAIATWGTINSETVFKTSECWCLRKGSIHLGTPDKPHVYCSHISR